MPTEQSAAVQISQGIRSAVAEVRTALKDGWQPGRDVPVILGAVYVDLISKLPLAEKLSAELDAAPVTFIRTWLNAALDIASDLTGKK
jgi:hypothetical protein